MSVYSFYVPICCLPKHQPVSGVKTVLESSHTLVTPLMDCPRNRSDLFQLLPICGEEKNGAVVSLSKSRTVEGFNCPGMLYNSGGGSGLHV